MASDATILVSFATLIVNCRTITASKQTCITNSSNVTVNPGCTIARDSAAGAGVYVCIRNLGGNLILNNCIVSSALDNATICTNVTTGTSTYNGCRIVGTGLNSSGVSNLSGTMKLKNVTIVGTGSGACLVAASTVKVYGACEANLAKGAAAIEQVNTITIDTNVT